MRCLLQAASAVIGHSEIIQRPSTQLCCIYSKSYSTTEVRQPVVISISPLHVNPYVVMTVIFCTAWLLPPPRSTQLCIPLGSLNRVPASAGVKAGKSPRPGNTV